MRMRMPGEMIVKTDSYEANRYLGALRKYTRSYIATAFIAPV